MATVDNLELNIPQEDDKHPSVVAFLNRIEKNSHSKFSAERLRENYQAVKDGLLSGLSRLGRRVQT